MPSLINSINRKKNLKAHEDYRALKFFNDHSKQLPLQLILLQVAVQNKYKLHNALAHMWQVQSKTPGSLLLRKTLKLEAHVLNLGSLGENENWLPHYRPWHPSSQTKWEDRARETGDIFCIKNHIIFHLISIQTYRVFFSNNMILCHTKTLLPHAEKHEYFLCKFYVHKESLVLTFV